MTDNDQTPFILLKLSAVGSTFIETELLIGSGSDCIVDDGERDAIQIYESNGVLKITALDVDIPVFLNGSPLKQSDQLANNDVVQFSESAEITVQIILPNIPVPSITSEAGKVSNPSNKKYLLVSPLFLLLVAAAVVGLWFQSKNNPAESPAITEAEVSKPPAVPLAPTPAVQPEVQLRAVAPGILEAPPQPLPNASTPDEWTIDLKSEIGCLVWNDPTQTLLAGLGNGRLVEIDPETGGILRSIQAHTQSIAAIAASSDGSRFATASYDNTIKIFSSFNDLNPRILAAHVAPVRAIDLHPFEPLLASAGADGFVMLWNLETGADIAWMLGHIGMVNTVKFSPNGSTLFSAGSDGTIHVWEATTGKKISTMPAPQTGINALVFSPDGRRLISAADGFLSSLDGIVVTPEQTLRLWDPATLQEIPRSIEINDWLLAANFTGDGSQILISTGGHPARPRDPEVVPRSIVIDAFSGEVRGARGGPLGPITGIVPHPDNRHYFLSSTDQMLRRLLLPQ